MSERRYRSPKAKPNQIKVQWGKLPDDNPDLCFAWGDGVQKRDASLINSMLDAARYSPLNKEWDDSILEELIKRGYDIKTLKFSIEKKKAQEID